MIKTWCIWASILILNFACTSTLSNQRVTPEPVSKIEPQKAPETPPVVIRVDPSLRLPVQDQIKWARALNRMSKKEREKVLRMLLDGMFKSLEELEREGKVINPRVLPGDRLL